MNPLHLLIGGAAAYFIFGGKKDQAPPSDAAPTGDCILIGQSKSTPGGTPPTLQDDIVAYRKKGFEIKTTSGGVSEGPDGFKVWNYWACPPGVEAPRTASPSVAVPTTASAEDRKKLMAAMILSRMANRPPPDQFGCMSVSSFSKDDAMAMLNTGWTSTGSIQGGYGSLCPPGTDMTCPDGLTQMEMLKKPGCIVAAGMRSVTTAPKGM